MAENKSYISIRHPSYPSWIVKAMVGIVPSALEGQFSKKEDADAEIAKYLAIRESLVEKKQERHILTLKKQDYIRRKQIHADKKAKQGSQHLY
jgi:hypothetical protein